MIFFRVIAALALAICPAFAVETEAMLKVPASARSAALGGAFGMVAGSAESAWYNPAGVGGLSGGEIGFSHSAWIGDSSTEFIYGGFGGPNWGLGAYGQYAAIEDMGRDNLGRETGAFTNSGQVAGLAMAGKMDIFRVGLGVKMLGQSVADHSAYGIAGDAGLIASFFDRRLAFSISALNLGSAPSLGSGNAAASAPQNLRVGFGLMRVSGMKFLGEYRRWNESGQDSLAGGVEWLAAISGVEMALRGGYESGLAEGGVAGLSAGMGLGLGGIRVDYSFQALGELGNAQRVSLDWRYKTAVSEPKAQDGPDPRMILAKSEYDAGHFKSAAEIYSGLALDRPQSFGIQSAAAMSYFQMGDKVSALKYFTVAKQLKPGRKEIDAWILRCEKP